MLTSLNHPMLSKTLPLLFLLPTVAVAQSYVVYDFTHNKILESSSPHSVRPIASVTKMPVAQPQLLQKMRTTSKAQAQNCLDTHPFLATNY